MSGPDSSDRIMKLEMTVAHLEHELEQMHSVLLAVQADATKMGGMIAKLERRIVQAGEPPESRSPDEERPPHY